MLKLVVTISQLRRMRANSDQLMERIFQLVTNHTVELSWVFPDTSTLLNEKKYQDINEEILFGLGFPRILITGESAKSGTSNAELATLAPIRTMYNFRNKIIEVIRDICAEVSLRNSFKSAPTVEFGMLNLQGFADFLNGLTKLYDSSALSRTDLARTLGFDFFDQLEKLEKENKELAKRGLPTVGPNPFGSPQTNTPGQPNTNQPKKPENGENTSKPNNKPTTTV
jgi:hypothetical protein